MVKSTENSKLYEIVIQTLSNYEASYNAADWEQMQSLLDIAPKSKSFKLKHILLSFTGTLKSVPKSKTFKFIFSLYSLIGVAVLIGVDFLYTFLNSPKTPNPIKSTPQQKNENTVNAAAPPVLALPTKSVQGNPKEDKTQKLINTADSAHAAIKTDLLKSNESVITKKENKEIEKLGGTKTESNDTNQQLLKKAVELGKPDSLNSSGDANRNEPTTNLNINRREKIISDSLTRYLNLQPQDSLNIPK